MFTHRVFWNSALGICLLAGCSQAPLGAPGGSPASVGGPVSMTKTQGYRVMNKDHEPREQKEEAKRLEELGEAIEELCERAYEAKKYDDRWKLAYRLCDDVDEFLEAFDELHMHPKWVDHSNDWNEQHEMAMRELCEKLRHEKDARDRDRDIEALCEDFKVFHMKNRLVDADDRVYGDR